MSECRHDTWGEHNCDHWEDLVVACTNSAAFECSEYNRLQIDYRGTKNSTGNGTACQRWDSQTPHEHNYTRQSYPRDGLEENYCRNPSKNTKGTWCYTTNPDVRWQYCDVPTCADCDAGEYKSASGLCEICPNNTYSGDAASNCTQCPDNTLSGEGSTSIDDCRSAECDAGEYKSANGLCEICPNNTYSSAGASNCTHCPNNTLSGEGSTSIDDCRFEQNNDTDFSYEWRLYNSFNDSGIVQVRRSDNLTWGTVCDDYINNVTANVLCKWLGYRTALSFDKSNSNALESLPIFLDNLVCNSGARSLSDCRHILWGEHNCGHPEDIVLTCTNSVALECSENNPLQTDYRGIKNTTGNGTTCQRWDSQTPQEHGHITPQSHPNDGLEENYCRNPDNEPTGAWCYTTNPDIRWEYCDVPKCVECDAGEYKSANGLCEICPDDTYSGDAASNCTQCPNNTLSGEGSASIDDCRFDCTSCKPELNEVCQNGECTCSSCDIRGTHDICVKRYQIEYTTLRLYDDAQLQCKSLGLDLATINSEEDSSAFKAAARLIYGDDRETHPYNTSNWIWIGATDLAVEEEYRFQNGDRLNFSAPWADKQPDHRPIGGLVAAPCILRNQEYQGSDILHKIGFSTVSQCIDYCLSYNGDRSCVAIVWRQSNETCWLKHSVPTLSTYIGVDSVNMTCIRAQPHATSMGEDQRHVAVSRWGEWDDSFGNYWARAYACSC